MCVFMFSIYRYIHIYIYIWPCHREGYAGPLPPQKWPSLLKRCAMCWNKWKIMFPIFNFSQSSILSHARSRSSSPNIFLFSRMDKYFNILYFYKSGQIYIKYAVCAETNKKSIFWFLVSEIWWFLYSKLVYFSMIFKYKIYHNSKTKNRKVEFSFVSAHCASFM